MSASHNHGGSISSNKMWIAFGLRFAFCTVEALIGYRANSLALMSDADITLQTHWPWHSLPMQFGSLKSPRTANAPLATTVQVFWQL